MSRAGTLITVAVPFVWLGMVLAISFQEVPLKFRAPGVTLPLGLQVLLLRPGLDWRAGQVMAGQAPPPARLHLDDLVLEGAKALALPALGVALASSVLP